jgi:hypothetical protein
MRFLFTFLIIAGNLALIACDKESVEEVAWVKPVTQTISCDDYYSEITPNGTLYNNVWNKHAAQKLSWSQCLEKNSSSGLYGWSWVWPTKKNNAIYAYPQIKLGTSPWAPTPNLYPEFPLDHSLINSLVIEHELDIQSNGEHNVATSLWLTNTKEIGNTPNPSAILAELMIWSYATPNHMNPAGTHTESFEIGSQTWEVWVDKNWSDTSGVNNNKWVYITFRAKNPSLKAKFDLIDFIDYVVEHQILPNNFYIADIELGTEIMSGSGLLWVKQFNVTIK